MDASAVEQAIALTKALREQTFQFSNALIIPKQQRKAPNVADLKQQTATMERLITQIRGLLPK